MSFTFDRSHIPGEGRTIGNRVVRTANASRNREALAHGSTKAIFNIKIVPTEKADLVKFMTEGFSSPDYPDHKAPELPK